MTSSAAALPTRQQEEFRYADLAAMAPLWPPRVEQIAVAAGEMGALTVVHTGGLNMVRELAIELADGARFSLHVLSAGTGCARITVRVSLGRKAQFALGAVQLCNGTSTAEIVTTVIHAAPDATSRQVVRSIAAGQSTANYLGKVRVERGADGTDGAQSVRAMLLDRTATANAKPELEIYADDVKCAHGCAVGELDADELFYMAARGIDPSTARRLMLQAFIAEAWLGAADEHALQAQAQAALEAML